MALFDFLYGEGQALGYIKKGLDLGKTTSEIIESLNVAGQLIRPDLATKVIEYLGTTILPDVKYIKQLQNFAQPNITRIPIAATKLLRNFSYSLTAQGINKATGEIVSQNISISTNTLLSKQQAMDMAADLAIGETKSGGLESAAVSVNGITQNPAGLVAP